MHLSDVTIFNVPNRFREVKVLQIAQTMGMCSETVAFSVISREKCMFVLNHSNYAAKTDFLMKNTGYPKNV